MKMEMEKVVACVRRTLEEQEALTAKMDKLSGGKKSTVDPAALLDAVVFAIRCLVQPVAATVSVRLPDDAADEVEAAYIVVLHDGVEFDGEGIFVDLSPRFAKRLPDIGEYANGNGVLEARTMRKSQRELRLEAEEAGL